MNNFITLLWGEVNRMKKNGITGASLVATLLWVGILHFSGAQDITIIFPLVLFVDASLMSLLLVGVIMMFEKQENSFKSLLVIPSSKDAYLLSKTVAVVISALTTLALLLIYGVLVRGITVSIPGLIFGVGLIAFAFAQAGILMAYSSRDFTNLLMGVMKVSFLLAIPTILEVLGILGGEWVRTIQYLNPTKAALVILQSTTVAVEGLELGIAIGYLSVLAILFYFLARRYFDLYAMKEGGS